MPRPIQQIIAEFVAAADALDARAATALADSYRRVYNRLEPAQAALIAEIDAMRESGKQVSAAKLKQLERYRYLTETTEREMAFYAGVVSDTTEAAAEEAAWLGTQEAEALMASMFDDAPADVAASIVASFQRVPREAVTALTAALQAESPLADLLATFGPEAADGIADALLTNLVAGRGSRVVAREMTRAWGVPLTRALTIARTETNRAHRMAAVANYRNNAHVVKGFRWHSALSSRTCMACIALHGRLFPLSETLDDHPNGRCAAIPVSKTWAELGLGDLGLPETGTALQEGDGEAWFRNQDEATQRRMLRGGKYDAWKAGDIKLSDLVHESTDRRWGRTFSEASLKSITGG